MAAAVRGQPYVYPTGLVEIPIQGLTDRQFFDDFKCVDKTAYDRWRTVWVCTVRDAAGML